MSRRYLLVVALLAAALFTGCEASDVVALRLDVKGDLSGKVTTRALDRPASGNEVEQGSSGVVWADRVTLTASQGSFGDLSALSIEDIKFAGGTAEGVNFLKVTIPLGDGLQWAEAFTIADVEERRRAAATFDPAGNAKKVGATLKIEIALPSAVISHGAKPAMAGLKEEAEKKTATLVIPVDKARESAGAITWHITW